MGMAFRVLLASIFLIVLLWVAIPPPEPPKVLSMPWQAQIRDDGSVKVAGVQLGLDTLARAQEELGPLEQIALFDRDGTLAIEAYFGTIKFGPLKARITMEVAASAEQLQAFMKDAAKREGTHSGAWRYYLKRSHIDALQQHKVMSMTYIPAYKGLQPKFFQDRFGKPDRIEGKGKGRAIWHYPDYRMQLLLDPDGPTVLVFRAEPAR